jgi:threonine dehydratase
VSGIDMTGEVSLDDIRSAAVRIRGVVRRTPVLEVGGLSLKCENFQPGGSFKIRGACNMIAQLTPQVRAAGVITYSSGNHGTAVALVAQAFGVPAVVVMPEQTPRVKVDAVRARGAEVVFAGRTSEDRRVRAEAIAAERALTIVPPFDHPWIIAGQGTTGLELLEQQPRVHSIYVPMGGGGQIAGISAAVKSMRDDLRVVGVEPAGAARMTASRRAGRPVTLETSASIADGLLTLRPGDITFRHVQALVDEIEVVEDHEIMGAVAWLFREAKVVAEPSGAAAVAAALRTSNEGALAVISGGNVDAELFARCIG